jgi:hypothetical protein
MGFLNISWWILGSLALVVALIYAIYVPKSDLVNSTKGLQFVIVRWFHSLVWVILAISFYMRGSGQKELSAWANPTTLSGGIIYIVFFIGFIRLK